MNSKDERELVAATLADCFGMLMEGQPMSLTGAVLSYLIAGWLHQANPKNRAAMLALFLALVDRCEADLKREQEA